MNDDHGPFDCLAERLAPPAPPDGLERRVLLAAREALARARSRDGWTRTWESPAWRLAWGTAIAVLLLAHASLSLVPSSHPGTRGPRSDEPTRGANGELAAIVSLPSLDVDCRSIVGAASRLALEDPTPRRTAPGPEVDKESGS